MIHALGDFPPIGVRSNGLTRNIVYDNLTVVGYAWGIQLPQTGYAVVRDGYYDNRRDFIVRTGLSPDRLVIIYGSIGFGTTAGGRQDELVMQQTFDMLDGTASYAFNQDTVILNYGPFVNQRAYFSVQTASAIPFPVAEGSIPNQYIGLTNQQLWDQFGVAIGGEIAPADAVPVPNVVRLVAPSPSSGQ